MVFAFIPSTADPKVFTSIVWFIVINLCSKDTKEDLKARVNCGKYYLILKNQANIKWFYEILFHRKYLLNV